MISTHWTIVQTRTRCEDVVERGLLNAGYRTYVPRGRVLLAPHGRERKLRAVMRPVFGGLVFVQDWRGWPSETISHVIGLMPGPRSGVPAKLSAADVAVLAARELQGEFDAAAAKRPPARGIVVRDDLEIGADVEFELSGIQIAGVLAELSAEGRAIVEASMFGRVVRHAVNAEALAAAG